MEDIFYGEINAVTFSWPGTVTSQRLTVNMCQETSRNAAQKCWVDGHELLFIQK